MNAADAVAEIDVRLRGLANPERAVQEKRYLKSGLCHLGVAVPSIRRVAKEFLRAHPGLVRPDLLAVARDLWSGGVHDHRVCAVELLEMRPDLLEPADVGFLERLIREARTWALADNLAASVVGKLLQRHPASAEVLDRWAEDEDFWIRRSALLALLLPLRRGDGDFERFSRYADAMLDEKEFFIRKAIGWVLRETGKERPGLVFEWLLPRARKAAGLTVREAVRHLPEDQRETLLSAHLLGRTGGQRRSQSEGAAGPGRYGAQGKAKGNG